ncbi:MAG: hypothetical protein CMJ61_04695, partial [Planctomycetaceae bacterium]|nr:hypothetical protein [Planctomycetaceae bacterium]
MAYRVGEAYDGPEPSPYLKRTGRKTEWRGEIGWDAATGSTGQAAADALLLREYREGWELWATPLAGALSRRPRAGARPRR